MCSCFSWLPLSVGITVVLGGCCGGDCGSKASNPFARSYQVGDEFDDVRREIPADLVPGSEDWLYMPIQLHGLDGDFAMEIDDGELSWILYSFYFVEYEELTEENFERCLTATELIIEQLTEIHGPPDEYNAGNATFRDPREHRHNGYDVLEAVWRTEREQIRAGFEFLGGKGVYSFVVKVSIKDVDSPI